ncbi:GIY-YIG nuclease family protein [Ornithinibacillus halophilus]|uniref:T5orf172 domain-containing protein n=1 Tax=Ornithinibacillus halophilus TaxID=930117 RepID=A0A1M5GMP3_9BACI|nr:GIY-YIG nuclease family protein [Ornithinibacillus halophilus]SHG04772.1 T5orf172 domain-containing protein [Ornithinibacillus halophilus]
MTKLTNNEELTSENYHMLIKYFNRNKDFLFNNVDNFYDYVGRLIYLYVSLFRDLSMTEPCLLALYRLVDEVFVSVDIEQEDLSNLVLQIKMAMEEPVDEKVGEKVARMERKVGIPGYVYVLSNHSMNNLVKIGHTTRDPNIRVTELSKHSGIPTPFILEYHAYFEDCIRAEERIHEILEKRGLRVTENREFFEVGVEEAVRVVKGVEGVRDALD